MYIQIYIYIYITKIAYMKKYTYIYTWYMHDMFLLIYKFYMEIHPGRKCRYVSVDVCIYENL